MTKALSKNEQKRREFLLRNHNLLLNLYPNTIKIYGPYLGKDSRYRVVFYDGSKRQTRQYAKIKMEVKLERRIEEPETVDHKDRNTRNDRYSNLQILLKSEHCRKDVLRRPVLRCICPICEKEFEANQNQVTNANWRKTAGPFCSRQCVSKYARSVQLGEPKLKNKKLKYKLKYRS